uniref:C-type lectin domain-containing protein n=1 Tax=Sinocyclocheilus rhinocerous TaxID=307959 RepID=A0A673MN67_9TELE
MSLHILVYLGFLWSDGNLFSYSKWETGQPNNLYGFQYCVSLRHNWFDYECFKLTWEEALLYCRTHHTDLASITTERQLELAKRGTRESQTESVWTGLRYLVGEWFWVSNQPLGIQTSLPECPTQPYQCGARNTKTDNWENRDCAEKLNFLCN